MNALDRAFWLITSLSPQERSYLSRNLPKKTKYFEFYELMSRMDEETYRDSRDKFKELKGRPRQQFPEALLKPLHNYWLNHYVSMQIRTYISEVEIFLQKSLFPLAAHSLDAAEKLAVRLYDAKFDVELARLKARLYRLGGKEQLIDSKDYDPKAAISRARLDQNTFLDYEETFQELIDLYSGKATKNNALSEPSAAFEEKLFITPEKLPDKARRFLFLGRILYFLLEKRFTEVQQPITDLIDWWNGKQYKAEESEQMYFYSIDLYNLGGALIKRGADESYPYIEQLFNQLYDLADVTKADKAMSGRIRYLGTNLKLIYYLNVAPIDQITNFVEEIEDSLSEYHERDATKLKQNVLVFHFLQKEYGKADQACAYFQNTKTSQFKLDFFVGVSLLRIICQYENKLDSDFLSAAIDNYLHYCTNRKKKHPEAAEMYTVYRKCGNLFRKWTNCAPDKRKKALQEFIEFIDDRQNELGYFYDLLAKWAQTKC